MDGWDYRWNWYALFYSILHPEERMSNVLVRYELLDWEERTQSRTKPWEVQQ